MKQLKHKTIVFVRHSKSSREMVGLEDIYRPLNQRGYEDAALMSIELAKQKIHPDAIISSPAIRAYSTALIFAEHLKYQPDKINLVNSLYGADVKTILNVIYNIAPEIDTVFLFGHNPDFENCINSLLKNRIAKLSTSAVCIINSSADNWMKIKKENCRLQLLIIPADFKEKIYDSEKAI